MRREPLAVVALASAVLTLSCEQRSPVAPRSSVTLDQFVQALRQQGFSVSVAGEIPPEVNHFFSVPAHEVRVNESQVNAFEYPSSEAAAADASRVSPDGQPSPTARITCQHPTFLPAGPAYCALRGLLDGNRSGASDDRRTSNRGRSHSVRTCQVTFATGTFPTWKL
jgi:hypothetical protein